ncbi:MAG: MBL fold metallo-hydrolase [Candidatus Hodarchaeota archaeon]
MLEQISDPIFMIWGENKGRFPFSNSILILEEKNRAILIDTGCGSHIIKELKRKYSITLIINSHTHPDHSAGNWLFENEEIPIYVPEEKFNTSGNIIALSERFTEPGTLAEYWRHFASESLGFRDCKPTHSFNKDSVFEFGNVVLQPIHTPGHTVDHYCFYEPNKEILFSFDYDLTTFGPWYGHRESNIPDFKQSIEKLKGLNARVLISGHKGIVKENIQEQLEQFRNKFDERDRKILALLQKSEKTLDQLVDCAPIYRQFPYAEPLLRYWEGQMVLKHLEELEKLKKVAKQNSHYFFLKKRD